MTGLRPASDADREWLLALVRSEPVAASLSVLAAEDLEEAFGRDDGEVLVVEDEHGERAGVVCWSSHSRRSRIAGVHTLAIDPAQQGRGRAVGALRALARRLVEERGFHRVQAETYGFSAAGRRAFVAAGFTEEGVRRRAYDRHGGWQDGVHFGLLADELG